MKKMTALTAALMLVSAGAQAGPLADDCKARMEADGRDSSGCDCLEQEVMSSDALLAEFQALGAIEDPAERYELASDEAKAAMDRCTR